MNCSNRFNYGRGACPRIRLKCAECLACDRQQAAKARASGRIAGAKRHKARQARKGKN